MEAGVLILWLCLFNTVVCDEKEMMEAFSQIISNLLLECKKESEYSNNELMELMAFWSAYPLTSRGMGCSMLCVTSKLQLFDADGKMRLDSVKDFGKLFGADEHKTAKVLSLLGMCTRIIESKKDECFTMLEIIKCFRYAIFQLGWAPRTGVSSFLDYNSF